MVARLLAGLLHHSFAMFETTKAVTLAGTVTAFEWTNPHAYIGLDVAGDASALRRRAHRLVASALRRTSG